MRRHNLPEAAVDTLMASWAQGSQDNYDSKWNVFFRWCHNSGLEPLHPEISTLLSFLQAKFEENLQHSTIRGYATAIGVIWRHLSGKEVFSDDLVSRFLSGVAKARPAAPKYEEFPDLEPLLAYVSRLDSATRRVDARCKAIVLLKIVTMARAADMARWLADSVEILDTGELRITGHKTKNVADRQTFFTVQPLPSDPALCPVKAFKDYWALLGDKSSSTFIWRAVTSPFDAITADTIGRIVRDAMSAAGIDVAKFQPNSLRGAAATRAVDSGRLPVDTVQSAGHWSSARVFHQHYLRSARRCDLTAALLGD